MPSLVGLVAFAMWAAPPDASPALTHARVLQSTSASASATSGSHTIELYSRPGCSHCAAAKEYLSRLVAQRSDVRVELVDVSADHAARARLREVIERAGITQAAVPTLVVDGHVLVGFVSAATTGREIERLLATAHGAAERKTPDEQARPGTCGEGATGDDACADAEETDGSDHTLHDRGLPLLESLGLPLFTIVLGLLDGFNPCAMWVLLFLLAMLVNTKSRKRMLLVAGVFVVVSGLVYYAFMAAWLGFFFVVGVSRTLQVGLGAVALLVGLVHVKDFFALHRGVSLSIPEGAKPGIYARARGIVQAEHLGAALVGATALAVAVNLVELLCTAGLPMVYTQVLATHRLPAWGHHAYLALYNLAYMADDALMVGVAVFTLDRLKLQERGGRVLKLVSGVALLVLGTLLAMKPEWLTWSP